ncbi:hypothetical protein POM88_029825 [Heracleum sosnowskyi]|uniref:Uncharacterized protein n=1 Tax=Heracleum sosnowskyi TaxID=360622 RepID=A0AAD8HWB2_9APIA|nr:hypothetical protein POM88_029825 [Heracleum sosnowskyi]
MVTRTCSGYDKALKGEDFWEFQSTEPLLPPDIPKKLRGRPKKLRRREDWEGEIVEKEGHQGEGSNNKPKILYKPKQKANVSWRNKNNEQKEATEEDIVYEADQSKVDDEQEHVPTQQRPKLTMRRRLPVSLQED